MMRNGEPEEPRLLHIILGSSFDPECEICRTHGAPPEAGMILLEIGSLDELLRCRCPLCAQARFESLEG